MTETAAKNAITAAAWKMGADVQTEEDGSQVLYIEYAEGVCNCGCHQPTNEGSRFRQGHDMKLVSKLLLAARNDLTVSVSAGGGMMTSGSAETMARHFGGAFPEKLANRAAAKKATKKAAKAEKAAPAVDENTPRSARCKVGRWIYDGTIEDGEFYYTNKKDEVVYVPKGKYTEVTGS